MNVPPSAPLDPEAARDLTRAILARTSGSACARLEALACAYVDGELEAGQVRLVQGHLAHCGACEGLVAALRHATAMLPRMAEADPGPWFTARVLRATVYAPRRSATHWRATWIQLLHRPRIALEAAYVGTAMGLLGLALPMPAFLPAPGDLVQTLSPAPLVAPLKAPAQRVLGQFAAAERRTATHLQQGLGLAASPAAGSVPAGTIWKRGTLRVRGWFHGLRRPPAEKAAPPTNS